PSPSLPLTMSSSDWGELFFSGHRAGSDPADAHYGSSTMASFGEALAALEDFRADLVNEQMNAAMPDVQALAFRASAGGIGESPYRSVHATGVGVRGNKAKAGTDDFVIKVYVFDLADVAPAAAEPLLARPQQGVEVDIEHLPVQIAYAKKKSKRKPA